MLTVEQKEDLQLRKRVCESFLEALKTVSDSDTRKAGAIEEYQRQLRLIEAKIKYESMNVDENGNVTIGLKTATLSAKASSLK